MNIIHNNYFFFDLQDAADLENPNHLHKTSYSCSSVRGYTRKNRNWDKLGQSTVLPAGAPPTDNGLNPKADSGEGPPRLTTSARAGALPAGKPEDAVPEAGLTQGCGCKELSFHLSTALAPFLPPASGGKES